MAQTNYKKQPQASKTTENKGNQANKGANILAFSKINYILLAIGMAIILIGFILLSGNSSTPQAYDPEIFNTMHIKVAPMVCLFGFLFIIVAILYHKNDCTPKQ